MIGSSVLYYVFSTILSIMECGGRNEKYFPPKRKKYFLILKDMKLKTLFKITQSKMLLLWGMIVRNTSHQAASLPPQNTFLHNQRELIHTASTPKTGVKQHSEISLTQTLHQSDRSRWLRQHGRLQTQCSVGPVPTTPHICAVKANHGIPHSITGSIQKSNSKICFFSGIILDISIGSEFTHFNWSVNSCFSLAVRTYLHLVTALRSVSNAL